MKISIGQRILCRLAGSQDITEQTVAGFAPAFVVDGRTVRAVLLTNGRAVHPDWIFAAFTA